MAGTVAALNRRDQADELSPVSFRQLAHGLRQLEIDRRQPIMLHASLSSFGWVNGGAPSVIGALLAAFDSLVAPTFTYKTMVTPEVGPADNACRYGQGRDLNRQALIFDQVMPADHLMGAVPEALRRHPAARRSRHPILSFSAINAPAALAAQRYCDPLAPIGVLAQAQGWVLLLGVDQTVNTSIHYAEKLAGRKQFIRWALTRHGARQCPGFPGCSDGFSALAPRLAPLARQVQIGPARVQALPLPALIDLVCDLLSADPLSLLCSNAYCERCAAVRLIPPR
jgi:aminoglycoside 3-N-acetyltransferase